MASMDIGIDLGTANTIITLGTKIIVNEPSVIAYNKKKEEVISIGGEAYKMLGRNPDYIEVVRPLEDGIISDHDMTMMMVREFVRKASKNLMIKPQVVICVPSAVTDVENRAVIEAALSAGARKVFLIKEPIAALLGSGADIMSPGGTMVVDIGGGTSDVAIVSLGGIVKDSTLKIAGNKFDRAIVKYFMNRDKLLIGEKTAEIVKKEIGCVFEPDSGKTMTLKGRNLLKGLPQAIEISEVDVYEALFPLAMEIVAQVKGILETAPPELVGDILSGGIVLTGGGALLGGLDRLIAQQTKSPCRIADCPLECVAFGAARSFSVSESLLDGFEKVSLYKYKGGL
ncbi:MAG: rod shape-determining protein [Oscillospiraceae bacterium]|nr:rod shape-determining protein [Oscillospiraceae bacterium]